MMKRIWAVVAVSGILLAGCGAHSNAQSANDQHRQTGSVTRLTNRASSSTAKRDRKAIKKLNRQQNYGMVHKDVQLLRQITVKGAKFIHMDGVVQTRDGWIKSVKTGSMTYYSGKTKSMTIQLHGNRAKAIVHNEVTARINGMRGTWTLRSENQLRKIQGHWKITRSQSYSE